MMSVVQQDGSVLRVMVGTASVSFCHKHVFQRFLGDVSSRKQQEYRLDEVI
jgi:hypothetical protein